MILAHQINKFYTMETLLKIVPKFHLFIVDNDYYNGLTVKQCLEENLGEEITVRVFPDAESCLQTMQRTQEKPAVVILEYSENKRLNAERGEHMVDKVKELTPEAAIIICSDKRNSEHAIKALAYGANDFVIKDRFQHEHILSAVKKSLHPAKM